MRLPQIYPPPTGRNVVSAETSRGDWRILRCVLMALARAGSEHPAEILEQCNYRFDRSYLRKMTQPSQADVLAALQAQSSSSRKRPSTSSYADHADPYTSLTTPSTSAPSATASSSRLNATRLYCPREGCGSLILLEQTGEWLTAEADAVRSPPSSVSGSANTRSPSRRNHRSPLRPSFRLARLVLTN